MNQREEHDDAVAEALRSLRDGRPIVVADDEDREDEGDLILAAEHATPESVAFFLGHTSGVLCVAVTAERAEELRLEPMVEKNEDPKRTAFTVTVDAREGTTTGISAVDRSRTILAIADARTTARDLVRPGHVFPLVARSGGVLKRAGHTEAAVDLSRMAGLTPAGLLSEIVTPDRMGMLRGRSLVDFAAEHELAFVTIADVVRARRLSERIVERSSSARVPTPYGEMTCHAYRDLNGHEHAAFVSGDVFGRKNVLARVHSECLTGDVFGSLRCDCGRQLEEAMRRIAREGGVVVYLRGQEGRGIGLCHKIRAYALQDDEGHDTVEANVALGLPVDDREYGVGAQILTDLGLSTLRLMTNNPAKYRGLEGYGLSVAERVPLVVASTTDSERYLRAKKQKLGHLLGEP